MRFMRLLPVASLAAVSIVTFAPPAVAEPASDEVDAPATVERSASDPDAAHEERPVRGRKRWYGWQTLIVDASAVVVMAGYAVASDKWRDNAFTMALGATVLGTYVLGGPIVHAAHGYWSTGFESLALRVGLPLGGALAGFGLGVIACGGTGGDGDVPCAAIPAAVVGGAGMIAAPLIDAFALAYEPKATESAGAFAVPVVSWVPGGASAGLAGRF